MPNLTVRNIPDSLLEQIRIISQSDRRSMNSEILVLLEQAIQAHRSGGITAPSRGISTDTQVEIWKHLSGQWDDARSTEEIVEDVYSNRTTGRAVDL